VAPGASCREQVAHFTGHAAPTLADRFEGEVFESVREFRIPSGMQTIPNSYLKLVLSAAA
jgi:hypothetical protein